MDFNNHAKFETNWAVKILDCGLKISILKFRKEVGQHTKQNLGINVYMVGRIFFKCIMLIINLVYSKFKNFESKSRIQSLLIDL